MGCADCCAKAIIIIINIFFFILGLTFLAAGIVTFVGKDLLNKYLEDVIQVNSNSTGSGENVEAAAEILDVFQPLFIALIVIGLLMIITSVLAMCGSCCSVNCMLITYVVIVLLIFAVHLALFIVLMVGAFGGQIKSGLQDSIDDKFVGAESMAGYSLFWNLIMVQYQCCGVDGYQDFNSSTTWNRYPDSGRERPLVTPVACCRSVDKELTDVYDCAYEPTDANSNWKTGCWGALNAEIEDNNAKNVVIGVTCGILGFELILAALTLCVIFQARKKGYN